MVVSLSIHSMMDELCNGLLDSSSPSLWASSLQGGINNCPCGGGPVQEEHLELDVAKDRSFLALVTLGKGI